MMGSRLGTEAKHQGGRRPVDFVAVMDQVIALLRQRGRLTYRTLQRQFHLDDAALEDLTVELVKGQRLAADRTAKSWSGSGMPPQPLPRPCRL